MDELAEGVGQKDAVAPLSPRNPTSIQEMFGTISRHYDRVNSILSFGIHHLWKKRLIRESGIMPGNRVLDCATGTGDLAFLFEKKLRGTGEVTGSDFCEPMLEVARTRAKRFGSKVRFEQADVMNLPYRDGSFDIASISFGIRNVQDPRRALAELGRVVKPGGKVLVLEFGQPHSWLMAMLFGFYSNWILPWLGGWISGQRKAYQYLNTSSATFPCRQAFVQIAHDTGQFSGETSETSNSRPWISFQGGIAYLYVLRKRL